MKRWLIIDASFIVILLSGCAAPRPSSTPTTPASTVTTISTVQPTSTSVQPSIEITANNVRVLSERRFDATVVKVAGPGTPARLLDAYREGDFVWLYTQFDGGRKGWIFTRYSADNRDVQFDPTAMQMIAGMNMEPTSASIPALLDRPFASTPVFWAFVPPSNCAPTDQDQYVYIPERLNVYVACTHVTGVVKDFHGLNEDDGDTTFDVLLDAPYENFVNRSNQESFQGRIHVEIICTAVVGAGKALCANDPDPLQAPFPKVGDHVWLEGRLVTDFNRWVELHPLYAWGPAN